jgi:type I restriction enzyme, S subunit
MEKQKNIPILRFPEFVNEWQLKKVGELTERISNPVNVKSEVLYNQIGIRSHGKGIFYKDAVTGQALGNKRVFWVKEDTFIVNIVFAWEQAVAKTTNKEIGMIASHRFPMYSPIATQSNLDYLLHFFLTRKGKSLLELASPGGAGRNKTLGQKEFENLKFLIPDVAEQTKISAFITAVDEKLSLLKQKKNLLEQYKKGIMQKIFSQEMRFKDDNGNEFPTWLKKKLGEIGTFQTSSIDKLTKVNEKEVFLVNYMNVYRHENINNITIKGFQVVTAKDTQIETCNLRKGDILFTPSSETPDDIGHSVVIFEDLENTVFSYHLMRFRPNIEIDILYSHYFCNIPSVLNQLSKLSTGSTRFTISVKSFSSIEIYLPSIKEQTKIANLLSAIDDKINLCNTQIEKMQEWKKGLLQKMFC